MKHFIDPKAHVVFRVHSKEGRIDAESLWAHDLGGDRYRIDNCPFFAYGVSLHDIVLAPKNRADARLTFQRVLSKSGNRTIRVDLAAVRDYLVAQNVLWEQCDPTHEAP